MAALRCHLLRMDWPISRHPAVVETKALPSAPGHPAAAVTEIRYRDLIT
jgi:hypothetical protein